MSAAVQKPRVACVAAAAAVWQGHGKESALRTLERHSFSLSSTPLLPSPSQARDVLLDRWQLMQRKFPAAQLKALGEVMKMTGLSKVKNTLMDIHTSIQSLREKGEIHTARLNARFEVNPGTGKTTIARHYADFLRPVSFPRLRHHRWRQQVLTLLMTELMASRLF